MKKLRSAFVAIVLLSLLPSCAQMRNFGVAVCNTQERSAEIITELGTTVGVGPVGPLVADVFNLVTELGCVVFMEMMSLPANVSDMVGITTPPVVEAEGTEPEGDGTES